MTDLGIIYYSACLISQHFGDAVRDDLMRSTGGRFPVVCVSHKLLAFGDVRVVVDATPSVCQIYRDILTGALKADTTFVAMAEDDTVYSESHWLYRPEPDVCAYDRNRLVLTRKLSDDGRSRIAVLYFRERTQMAMGMFHRQFLIDVLSERFEKYPDEIEHETAKKMGWGEPGRYEKNLRLTRRRLEYWWSKEPSVTANHSLGIMGRRQVKLTDILYTDAEPWGNANDLWRRIVGK